MNKLVMKKFLTIAICSLCGVTAISTGTLFALQGAGVIDLFSDEVKVVFRNYDNSFLWKTVIPTGSSVSYKGATPTRPSTELYEYSFVSWDKSLADITKDTVFHAQFYAQLKEFKVTFQNWNHKDLYTDYVVKGGTAEYVGAIPTRENDEKYSYTFNGWDKELTNVQDNLIVTALFDTSPVQYTVTFKNEDTVLYRDYVNYGEAATYKGLEPTREKTAFTYFVFKGWDKDISKILDDVETQALFDEVPIVHTVRFLNYDGELLYSCEVGHNQEAKYMGPTPYRAPSGPYAYTFKKWNKPIDHITSDIEVFAEYEVTDRVMIVNFFNYDGEYLYTASCLYGKPAFYEGPKPTRIDDSMYTYEFDGWDRDIYYVTEDITAYATYKKTLRKFNVVFTNYDGEILYKTEVEYGKTAVYFGDTPVKNPKGSISYKFIGWDKELENITEDTVFVALFKEDTTGGGKTFLLTFYNYDGEILDYDSVLENNPGDYGYVEPTRPYDSTYGTYYFVGWSDDFSCVTDDMDLYAQYETSSYYIVSYRNNKGDLLYEDYVYKWSDPKTSSYKGYLYDYLLPANGFLGWDKDLNNITKSITVFPIKPGDVKE